MIDSVRLSRLRWRCRRGMLENDLVLTRYLDARGAAIGEDELAMLDVLLDLPDQELWDLIAGRVEPPSGGRAARRRAARPLTRRDDTKHQAAQAPSAQPYVTHPTENNDDRTHSHADLLGRLARGELPRALGHGRPRRHRHPDAVRQDRQVHLRPGFPVDRVLRLRDHLHRRRQGRAAVPRLPDRAARDALRLPRGLPPAALRRAARRRAEQGLPRPRDQAHDGQRADAVLPARLPSRRPPDGRADGADRRDERVLPGLDQPPRRRTSATSRRSG